MNIRHTFRYIKKVIKKFFTIAISVVLSFSLMLQAPFTVFASLWQIPKKKEESISNLPNKTFERDVPV